jgi:sugar fermentation stimulation protein A
VEELQAIAEAGEAAAVVFVVQRPDADWVVPHAENDPALAAALRRAVSAGVRVIGYRCAVSLQEIRITDRIPVCVDGSRG